MGSWPFKVHRVGKPAALPAEIRRDRSRAADAARPNAYRRGYGRRWAAARVAWLQASPLCVVCAAAGRTTAASVVDHIRPHRGDPALFWDRDNWQSLCAECHNRKTATQDGGFG